MVAQHPNFLERQQMTQPQHLVCLEHPTRQGLVCKLGQRVKGFDKDICFFKKICVLYGLYWWLSW